MTALIVDIVPPKRRGTYFGTLSLLGGIAGGAALLYGIVAELLDIRWTFLIASVFLALAAITEWSLSKKERLLVKKNQQADLFPAFYFSWKRWMQISC